MDIKDYTVTDADGKINTKKGTVVLADNNPYRFYIDSQDDKGKQTQVNLILPLGGEQSGLYRFPRVGEKVLVVYNDKDRYLLGYVPTSGNRFARTDEKLIENVINKYGEVFRYQKMGDIGKSIGRGMPEYDSSEYSEIGFYKEQADFVTLTKAAEDAHIYPIVVKYDYKKLGKTDSEIKSLNEEMNKEIVAKREDLMKDQANFFKPQLDRINIESTGDIYSKAINNYSIKAKRFDLKVNNGKASISMTADGEIKITAAKSITLKVGRTTVKLDDFGFSAKSKLVTSDIPNTWDAGIKLNPRNGFSASGINCKLAAVRKVQIGDGFGGSISSGIGVGSIKGREVKLGTYNSLEYIGLTTAAALDLVQNITSASYHNKDNESTKVSQRIAALSFSVFQVVRKWIFKLIDLYGDWGDLQKTRAEAEEAEKWAQAQKIDPTLQPAAAGSDDAEKEAKKTARDDAIKANQKERALAAAQNDQRYTGQPDTPEGRVAKDKILKEKEDEIRKADEKKVKDDAKTYKK
ncbi:hypothetical protein AGMMS50268_15300 [Spirochaetia bacterium]|nr:hypothetical protein AGMMS50268_15300 [Spirochaetia bacterium]